MVRRGLLGAGFPPFFLLPAGALPPVGTGGLVVVFYEFNPLSRDRRFIERLRGCYPACKVVYYFTNYIRGEFY